MFGFKANVIRTIDALLETNAEQKRVNDAHQQSIDALIETNNLLRQAIDRQRQRIELLEQRSDLSIARLR